MKSLFAAALLAVVGLAHAQDVPASVKAAVAKADAAVAAIVKIPKAQRTFDNTLGALDLLSDDLDRATSITLFLRNVSTDAKERADAGAAEEFLGNYYVELGKREDLYRAVKEYADTKPSLKGEQKRMLEFTLRDYRRAGMDLPKDKRDLVAALEKDLNKIGLEFEENIAVDTLQLPLTEEELKGVPEDARSGWIKQNGNYLVPMTGPAYSAIVDFAQNPSTRQKARWIWLRRGGQKNVELLAQLLQKRDELAHLLGYKNTVDFEIETRMAKNSETVAKFYADLKPILLKKALVDKAEFTQAKRDDLKDPRAELDPWDYSYYKRVLLEKKYAIDSEKVQEYFSVPNVLKGLFDVTGTLFSVTYTDVTADAGKLGLPVWHKDVKLYEVKDKATGKLLGRCYMDLYPRPGKYTHAACWGLQVHRINDDGSERLPLVALVCNLNEPQGDKPALLSHDDVETLFHEFGHGLHGIFSQSRYARFAGTGVARDFVEAPSQMLENWVWDPAVLGTFAKHYKTGEPLPVALLEGMKKARTLGSGIETQGQVYLGEMDQKFHLAPGGKIDTTKAAFDVYNAATVYKQLPGTLPEAAFGHLVGYEGAYYGYLWSLVYAQDMFTRFESKGLLNPEAGKWYRDNILAKGGTEDEMDILKAYLGREPKMDAFLKSLGLDK